MKKFVVPILVAVTVILAAITFVTFPRNPQNTRPENTKTSTPGGSSTTNTSNSVSSAGTLLMTLSPETRLVAPGMNNNFTLNLFKRGNLSGPLTFSTKSPSGLSVNFSPSSIAVIADAGAVDVNVRAASTMLPATYQVVIQARSPVGVFNTTFQVQVLRYLVLIGTTGFIPGNLTVKVGSTVTWMNINPGTDDNGYVYSFTFTSVSVKSPELHLYDAWTYTFNEPGSYEYRDSLDPQLRGEILVIA